MTSARRRGQRRTRRGLGSIFSLAIVAIVLASQVGGVAAQTRLSIATGGTGGVYYPYGGGLANILSDNIDDIEVTAEVTAASVDNMLLIESGDADLAFVLGDTAFDAVEGNAPFEAPIEALALATLYNNYTHVVTTDDAGINSVADLRGKRVSTGAPGSGTEIIANRMLEAAGLNPETDIEREQLGAAESAAAIKDRRLDAFFWSGGLPTGAVTDLGATPNIALKLVGNADLTDGLRERYGGFYSTETIPGGTYPGQDEAVDVVVVPTLLVVGAEFDEQLAYDVVRVMLENQPELVTVHPEARNLTLENASRNSPIPFHPGAIRYFEEMGITPNSSPVASPAASPPA
ncbi:MAG: TRAP transporter solute receptor, TAXI family precursor [uncultured Thermomicrobiales bacterium]|uniref:TRAP transporter solute receptor, TAXI family n=1 Tax=uncultured Thermomicrobiales bacterium TaxID=1645740 RepID=A0A6J4UJ81_9BACT|nr:MAG: TRAP transporter solute receptor, TAXI family precursor [uncultured Thermomicrobiales bacterium]